MNWPRSFTLLEVVISLALLAGLGVWLLKLEAACPTLPRGICRPSFSRAAFLSDPPTSPSSTAVSINTGCTELERMLFPSCAQ